MRSGRKVVVCIRFSFSVRFGGGWQRFLEEPLGQHLLLTAAGEEKAGLLARALRQDWSQQIWWALVSGVW